MKQLNDKQNLDRILEQLEWGAQHQHSPYENLAYTDMEWLLNQAAIANMLKVFLGDALIAKKEGVLDTHGFIKNAESLIQQDRVLDVEYMRTLATKQVIEPVKEDEYVYSASGESCEYTHGSIKEAFDELTCSQSWGVILKHLPFSFNEGEKPDEKVLYEHLSHLKP